MTIRIYSKGVTPECFNRGSSSGLACGERRRTADRRHSGMTDSKRSGNSNLRGTKPVVIESSTLLLRTMLNTARLQRNQTKEVEGSPSYNSPVAGEKQRGGFAPCLSFRPKGEILVSSPHICSA
jgi:hypothetical protein